MNLNEIEKNDFLFYNIAITRVYALPRQSMDEEFENFYSSLSNAKTHVNHMKSPSSWET